MLIFVGEEVGQMATKRRILEQLVLAELRWIAESHDLAVEDWRRLDALIEAIQVLSKSDLAEALSNFPRDRLKQICRHLDLEDVGKEKADLVDRIIGGQSSDDESGSVVDEDEDVDDEDEDDEDEDDEDEDDEDEEDRENEGEEDDAGIDDDVDDEKAKPEVGVKSKPKRPLRLFIGSSVESLKIARRIQVELDHDFDVTIWHQNLFEPGTNTWPQLIKQARTQFDFALFVFGSDDEVHSRGVSSSSPRDNVLLEYGLFVGALGSKRTFFLHNRDHKPKIASDLAGITALTYKTRDNLQAALGPACTQLADLCERIGPRR